MSDQNKTKEQLLLELAQARLRIGELEHSLAECVGQKEAGQRVTASRLLQALELGNLAYWEFDIPRQIFHLNDQYLALLGTSVAQEGGYEIPVSSFIHRFVHPEDVSVVAEEIRKGIETTDPNYRNMAEFRLKRVDGKIIHVLVSFGIDKDENGRTVLGYGTNQDITERKHTEQALEIERSRLKAVLDNMPLGVFMIEAPLGTPILANQKAIEILGKGIAPDAKSEDLSEVYAAYLVGTDQLYPTERLPIINGLQGRSIKIDDMEVRRPDGQNILLEVAGAPVYDNNGNIIASVIAFQDITERKQTQNSLQRERGLLRSLIDSVPDLIFYKDEERIYLGCNKAFEQFAGIKEADMVGKSDTDLFPRDVAEFFREQDRQMLAERNSRRNEEWVTYPDGRRALLDTLKTPFYTDSGDILGLIGISRDITEARQTEQMIAERARQLATVAKVSTAVSTILEPQAMLQAVVDLTKESFNLYHAHIYTLDEEEQKLVLTSGAGQVGAQMVAEGRSISYDAEQSLVARSARSRQGVIVNDVYQDPGFLPNPLLPDTQAEMAVPIIAGDKLLGVLDVQAEQINRFSDEDITILTTLGTQVAVALQNARQYDQVRQSEQLVRAIIDSTPDWIYIKDRQHRYQLVNQSYARSVHLSVEDILGKDDLEIGHPEELVKGNPQKGIRGYWADDNEVMNEGHSVTTPRNFIEVDGQLRMYNTYKVPLRDADNNVRGVLAFARDMTERELLFAQNESLYDASRRLIAAQDVQELVAAVAEGMKVPDINRAVLFDIHRDEEGEWQDITCIGNWHSGVGSPPTPVGRVYAKGAFPGVELFINPEPIFFDDIQNDKHFYAASAEVLRQQNILSMAVIPLFSGSNHFALLLLESEVIHRFTDLEIRSYPALVGQMASRLQNLRLIEQTRANLAQVQQAQQFQRVLLDNIPAPIFFKDTSGAYLGCNNAFEQYLGRSEAELISKTVYDLNTDKRLADQYHEMDMQIIRTPGTQTYESQVKYADGSMHDVIFHKSTFLQADGSVGGLIGIINDITERKKAEQELRVSEEYNKVLFAGSRTPLIVMDLETATYVDCNQAAVEIYRYASREEVIGKNPLDVSAPVQYDGTPSSEAAGKYIQECIEKGQAMFEWRHQRPDGEIWDASVHLMSLKPAGRQLIQFSLQDITERRRAEAALTRRAVELATVARVSTAVSTILEPQEMLQTVCNLTKENFHLYHAHIYIFDPVTGNLTLTAGAGQTGKRMVAEGRSIPIDAEKSLVARAARTREGFIVNDVHQDPEFLSHPLLPDTRSEMAVAMQAGEQLIGVLDVQAETIDRFSEEDINILTTLGAQVAVALQNARQYEQAARLGLTVEQSLDGAAIANLDGVIEFVNPAYANMHGLTVDECIGQPLTVFHTPEQVQNEVEPLLQEVSNTGSAQGEIGHVRKDGTIFPSWMSVVILRNRKGEPIGWLAAAQDITARKQAQAELEAQQRTLQAVLDNMPAGVFMVEAPSGKPLLANTLATAILGRGIAPNASSDDLSQVYAAYLGDSDEIYPAEKLPIVRGMLGEITKVDDMVVHRPDGVHIPLEVSGAPIRDGQGNIVASVIVFQDISERLKAEQERLRLQTIIDATPDFLGIANSDGNLIYLNQGGRKIIGYGPTEDISDLTIRDCHPEHAYQELLKGGFAIAAQEGTWNGESFLQTRDGREIPVSMVLYDHKDEDGNIQFIAGVMRDITAIKAAQQTLSENEARFRSLVQAVPDMIFRLDPNYIFVDYKGAEDQLLYVPPEVFLGKVYTDVLPPHVSEPTRKAIEEARATGTIASYEYQLPASDGSLRTFEARISVSPDNYITDIVRDVTNTREAERILAESAAQLHQAMQIAQMGAWQLDLNTQMITLGEEHVRLMGLEQQAALTLPLMEYAQQYVHPEDVAIIADRLQYAVAHHQEPDYADQFDYRLITTQGETLNTVVSIRSNASGVIQGVTQNITERKQAERALAENEARFRSLVSNVPSTIYRCALDAHYTMLFISDAIEEMSGYPASDFLGNTVRSYASIIHPDDTALVDQTISAALAANTSYNIEYRILHADGQVRWVYESGLGVKDTFGNVAWLDGSISDITERKEAQAAMETQQRTLQAVLDNMPAGLFMVEAPSGKTLLANRLATEILGRGIAPDATPEELSQVYAAYKGDSDELYPMQELPLVRGLMGEVATVTDMVVHRSDGKHIPLEVTGSPVRDAQGNIVASVIVFQDITERLQNQEAITRRARELAVVAQLSTSIATILEPQTLLQTVSDLAKQNFNFYHAHVYLLNEAGDTLLLAAGAGNIGRQMVAERRSIPFNAEKSLVARAARSRQGVIVNNVYDDPDFLPHPLLPETRSEMAIPLIAGERVLGVLDVQANTVDRFSEEDVSIQTTLAAQVAIALQNARQYNQVSRLSLTVEQSLDGATLTDLNGVVEFANSAWANMHGMSVEECVGRPLPIFHTAEQLQNEVEPALQQTNATGSFRGEVGHVRKDGTTFPTWMNVVVVHNSAGQPIGWMASAQDITERKQAEAALETQQRTLQAVLDNMPAGVFMVESPSGKPLLANTLAIEILGRGIDPNASSEDLSEVYAAYRGDSDEIYPTEKLPVVRGMLGEASKIDDMVVHRSDGKRIPLEVAGAPVHDAQGNIVASVIVFQDITERKEAQATLEAQQRTLQAVLDNMPAGLFMVEAPSGKTLLANRLATEILGRGIAADALPEELSEVYAAYKGDGDELYPMQELPLVRGLMGETTTVDDMVVHRSDGKRIPLEVTGSPVRDAQSNTVASVIVFQDITERRQTQEAIARRARELAIVAHLSTTMSTILEPQMLLQTVSDLAKQNFNLYHAHIYLLSEAGDTLVLTAGAGDIGRQMVAEKRTIAMDAEKSLVARAARSQKGVIVNNVYEDPDFLPHPLLPETRSEMAIPLIAGERVLGVLDIQADTINHFSEEDVSIQTTLAAQAAVALQNARQYQQVQESERLVRTIIDSTPDWIYIKDRQHRYRMVNQSYAQNVHLSPEEILGKDDIEVGHPEEMVRGNPEKGIHGYWADDNEVMDGGHPITNPRNFIRVAGEERLFNTYKVPLRDAENNVWGVLAFSRDMTERENLLQETQRLFSEIDTLYNASRRLSAARSLSEMTSAVAEGLKVKGTNRALLLSIERDSDGEMSSLTILANWYSGEGHPPSPVGTVYRKDMFAMLRFLLSPVPVFFNDVSTDDRIDDNMRTVLDRLEIRSLATLPLWLGERQIGVFALEAQELHTFGETEIRSYPSLAGQLAIALENWRLLEETQNRARREQTLREITTQVRGAIDPETILRTAVRELGATLGRQSFIRLGNAEELSHAPDQDTHNSDDQQAGAPAKGR